MPNRPKPSIQRRLEGNPGRRPLNPNEPVASVGLPRCPRHLEGEARREWFRLGKQLVAENRIAFAYKAVFAAYCQAWGRMVEAEERLRIEGMVIKSPKGYPIQNPFLAISNRAHTQLMRALTELGISPASQSKVSTVSGGTRVTRLQAFIEGKGRPSRPNLG